MQSHSLFSAGRTGGVGSLFLPEQRLGNSEGRALASDSMQNWKVRINARGQMVLKDGTLTKNHLLKNSSEEHWLCIITALSGLSLPEMYKVLDEEEGGK